MSSRSQKVIRVAALTTLASLSASAFAGAPAHRTPTLFIEDLNTGLVQQSPDFMGFNAQAYSSHVAASSAAASFTWNPFAVASSFAGTWNTAANWSPAGVPGSTAGFDDVVFPNYDTFGNQATLNIANANLNGIAMNSPYNNRILSEAATTSTITTPVGGSLNLSSAQNFRLSPTGERFLGTLRSPIDAQFIGAGSVNFTGLGLDGFTGNGGYQVWFTRQSSQNGITLSNGAFAFLREAGTVATGRPVAESGAGVFGTGPITLNGGKIQGVSGASPGTQLNFTQTVNVGTLGGAIEFGGGDSPLFSGDITGTGTLRLGYFGDSFMNRSYSFAGTLLIDAFNFNHMFADAALPNVQAIDVVGARFDLEDNLSASAVNRVPDGVALSLWGSGVNYVGAPGFDSSEDVGTLSLRSGLNTVTLIPELASGTRVTLEADALQRADRSAVLFVRGAGLGNTGNFVSGNSVLRFTNAPTLLGAGGGSATLTQSIVPAAFGIGGTSVAAVDSFGFGATLLTYDATNGVRALDAATEHQTNISAAGAGENVYLSASANSGAARTINSLTLSNSDNTAGGVPVALTGGQLTITSGHILNTAPGNTIANNIAFGSAEGVIIAAPVGLPDDATGSTAGGLAISGVISGSNGLSVVGGGDVLLTGANTFTGPVTVSSAQLFVGGNVTSGVAGPLGQSSDPIRLVAGGDLATDADSNRSGSYEARLFNGTNGTVTINRPIEVSGRFSQRNTNIGAAIGGFQAGAVTVIDGTVNIGAGADLTLGGGQVIVNGVVSGSGRLATNGQGVVTINSANTYSGGTEIGRFPTNLAAFGTGGTLQLGNDAALGTGQVYISRAVTLEAIGGPRNIPNAFTGFDGFTLVGSNPITFSGPFDLNVLTVSYTIGSLSSATFSGAVTRGGLFKLGTGTLTLTGNNTGLDGILSVGNPAAGGPVAGGVLIMGRGEAFGSGGLVNNNTQVVTGSTLRLDASLNGGAPINFDDDITVNGQGHNDGLLVNLGAIQNVSGNNTTTGDVILTRFATETANNTLVSVAGGSSFTAQGTVFDLSGVVTPASPPTPATRAPGTAVLTKVGGGRLAVGATFNNQIVVDPNTGTTTLSQRVAFNRIEVNEGTFAVTQGVTNNEAAKHLYIKDLVIAGGAQVDLANNSLLVDYTGTSPRAAVEALITSGRAGGTWTGAGIVSSSANAGEFALGVGDVTDTTTTTNYLGTTIDTDTVIVRYTRYGDANLDGVTNIADFSRLAANFNSAGRWATGDFNYDQQVSIGDFSLLAANFNLTAIDAPGRPGAVPEPAAMGALALAAAGLLSRRRRA